MLLGLSRIISITHVKSRKMNLPYIFIWATGMCVKTFKFVMLREFRANRSQQSVVIQVIRENSNNIFQFLLFLIVTALF